MIMKRELKGLDDVVRRLNDGLERTSEELEVCKK